MSLTASAVHGSPPCIITMRQVGEVVEHLVEVLDVLRPARHAGPDDPAVDADRDVELHALHVDRVHLLVVDGDLRDAAAREAAAPTRCRARPWPAPSRAASRCLRCGSTRHAQVEAAGVLAASPGCRWATARSSRSRCRTRPSSRRSTAPDRHRASTTSGTSLNMYCAGNSNSLQALLVLEVRPGRSRRRAFFSSIALVGEADPEIDDPDVGRHGHARSLAQAAGTRTPSSTRAS